MLNDLFNLTFKAGIFFISLIHFPVVRPSGGPKKPKVKVVKSDDAYFSAQLLINIKLHRRKQYQVWRR